MIAPRAAALACLCAALPCLAAPAWIATPETLAFRQRVIELAVRYGESGGIDTNGFLIRTRLLDGATGLCRRVEVVTTLGGEPVARESAEVCPK